MMMAAAPFHAGGVPSPLASKGLSDPMAVGNAPAGMGLALHLIALQPVPEPVPTGPEGTLPAASAPASQPPAAPPPPANGSEVVVTARSRTGDPLQDVNVASFNAAQDVDKAVFGPAAKAYRKGIPKPIRSGLRNFLNNLREPVVFVNFLLQLKPGKAAETAGRFAVNSTIGLAGLIDVAKNKPFHLPRRRNGFANTLGYYGVKPGPFFFAPLLGPTTLRDLFGDIADQAVPVGPIRPFGGQSFSIPVAVLSALDYRAEFDDELERQRATADPYSAAKRYYLERRQAEIDALRGRKRKPEPASPPVQPPQSQQPAQSPPPAVSDSPPTDAPPLEAAVAAGRVMGPPA